MEAPLSWCFRGSLRCATSTATEGSTRRALFQRRAKNVSPLTGALSAPRTPRSPRVLRSGPVQLHDSRLEAKGGQSCLERRRAAGGWRRRPSAGDGADTTGGGGGAAGAATVTGHSRARQSSLSSVKIKAVYGTNANGRDGNLLLSQ